MDKKIALTGIKPTGELHIGNYFGAIVPALELTKSCQAYYFLANCHALNTIKKRETMVEYTYKAAASWLACGLDETEACFFLESDIPEIYTLSGILMSFSSKGLINRAHAYKQSVDENRSRGKPDDHNINMGLFTYPILMAADILLFDTNYVPVGKDQKQHVEMAIEIANTFNHTYNTEILTVPKPIISEAVETIKGLDGNKMSKSYNNTIPLFCSEKELKRLCNRIVTNSQEVDEPKDPEGCTVFYLYTLFATEEEQRQLADRYRAGGMGWGVAKKELFHVMNRKLAPMREKYHSFLNEREKVDIHLQKGKDWAQKKGRERLNSLLEVVGWKRLADQCCCKS